MPIFENVNFKSFGMKKNYLLVNDFLALTRLSQAEYVTFMNHVLLLVKDQLDEIEEPEPENPDVVSLSAGEEGVPEIGVDASFVNEMEQEILLMSDVVNETTIAQETEAMQEHEKNRDNLATYILTRITCAG